MEHSKPGHEGSTLAHSDNETEDNILSMLTSCSKTSLLDEWMDADPEFPTGGGQVKQTHEFDGDGVWHERWPGVQASSETRQKLRKKIKLDREAAGKMPLDNTSEEPFVSHELSENERRKLVVKRERNKQSAQRSRERQKQNHLQQKEKFENLTNENRQLVEDIENLKDEIATLVTIRDAFIHEGSCSDSAKHIDVQDPEPVGIEQPGNITVCENNCKKQEAHCQRVVGSIRQDRFQQEVGLQHSYCVAAQVTAYNKQPPLYYSTNKEQQLATAFGFYNQELNDEYLNQSADMSLTENPVAFEDDSKAVDINTFEGSGQSTHLFLSQGNRNFSFAHESSWSIRGNQDDETEAEKLTDFFLSLE